MAPRRKKQKTKHASVAADVVVRSTAQPAIDRLPTELLQMSFEYLSFHDLIRCRHVCGKWFLRIPGDDTELRKILFLTTDLPPWTRELYIHTNNRLHKPFGHIFAIELFLPFIVTRHLERLQINPVLETLKWNKLAYPRSVEDEPLSTPYYEGYSHSFRFSSVERLREKATRLESRIDQGLWTDMLICNPPVQRLELRLIIFLTGFCIHLKRTLADDRGIRLQSLVASLRSLLKEVADNLMVHKITLRHRRILEILDWWGDDEG